MADPFDDRYLDGVLEEDAPEPPTPRPRLAPREPLALRGTVLTPRRRLEDAYVEVHDGLIARVGTRRPSAGTRVLRTDGVILPGLVDLHGHPEYNVFAPWEPPRLYANRYAWRRSDEYGLIVRKPWQRLSDDPTLLPTLTRYAEARALVGGVTAIQGASARYPNRDEALVRNVDRRIFGEHRARSVVDLGRTDPAALVRLRRQIDAGEVRAVYVHLAEGIDDRSRREWDDLVAAGLLTAATVVIHGTALSRDQLADLRDAGGKLVWSPQSNLRLYGDTTRVADAIALGLPVALGADWQPSGSPSLLAELQVARRVLALQRARLTARRLVQMVTRDAAEIAGLGDRLGTLAAGRPADLLVLERHADDAWDSVVASTPASVELVMVGGDAAYGRADWFAALFAPDDLELTEPAIAWGKPMRIDTRYSVASPATPPPRLAELRAALIERYPQVGPIWA